MFSQFVVHILDDVRMVRECLNLFLAAQGFSCCEHRSAIDLMGCDRLHEPGCAVIDLHLGEGELSGLNLLDKLAEIKKPLPVIAITGDTRITTGVQAFRKGAFDLLIKPFPSERLLAAVQSALRIIENPLELEEEIVGCRKRLATLAPFEIEVLARLLDGDARDRIAQDMKSDAQGVEQARLAIMAKMEAASLVDLARMRELVAAS